MDEVVSLGDRGQAAVGGLAHHGEQVTGVRLRLERGVHAVPVVSGGERRGDQPGQPACAVPEAGLGVVQPDHLGDQPARDRDPFQGGAGQLFLQPEGQAGHLPEASSRPAG